MSLIARLEDELKEAMRDRDAERRDALRLILNSLRSAEKELQRPLNDQEELQVLQRERKRRVEGRRGGGGAGGALPPGWPGRAGRCRGLRARGAGGVHARAAERGRVG